MVDIDVPAGVGAPPLDTQQPMVCRTRLSWMSKNEKLCNRINHSTVDRELWCINDLSLRGNLG